MKESGRVLRGADRKKTALWRSIKNARYIYLMILPAIVFYIIFNYVPMYGIRIAFQDFYPKLGISGSESVGFANFAYIFAQSEFWRAFLLCPPRSISRKRRSCCSSGPRR